ncbi:MAG: C4-type zinc ribbon domain-containing protein [Rikenellaceae bacterium]
MATKKKETTVTESGSTTAVKAPSVRRSSSDAKEFSTAQKIAALYDLQLIDSRIDEIEHIKGSLPLDVEDMENSVEGAKAQIEKYTSEVAAAVAAVKAKKEEIEDAKILIGKYEEQQKSVRNNREFESLGKQIEYQHLEIELCEKRIKEFNAEAKAKRALVEESNSIRDHRIMELEAKKLELAGIEEESADELASLQSEANVLRAKIDERLLNAYTRIRSNSRNGLAVVTVERSACGGCFNRIPPQRQIDIESSKKVIVCEYCGRVLVSSNLTGEIE